MTTARLQSTPTLSENDNGELTKHACSFWENEARLQSTPAVGGAGEWGRAYKARLQGVRVSGGRAYKARLQVSAGGGLADKVRLQLGGALTKHACRCVGEWVARLQSTPAEGCG